MFFDQEQPFIIAGPCSAETEEQVMSTAAALAGHVHLFRAGVWKPRTRPGSFEGNGAEALRWLQQAKAQYQLPFTIEVAEPEHIALAAEYGAAAVWIGARTTVNPFQVQKLAEELAHYPMPVLVKNPVTADIDLWQGAIERFEKVGLTDVAAIHRGFTGHSTGNGGYRNPPNWPIPIELKRRRPQLPIICDPSHITGNRSRVAAVAQKALDMRFDGLMIETHPNPPQAWTDAAQQITPDTLLELLATLIVRKEFTADNVCNAELEALRQAMDSIDQEIVDLIARRMELSAAVGAIKRKNNITVYQPARWAEIVNHTTNRALLHGLNKELIQAIYERIHHESITQQLQQLTPQPKEIKN
ncbi:MAG: 3-deoxy-7-phosphoheptulonate synthase [Chitinophagia bacterium]|nr:3-deoxy-7-phosphoheptulonate synthase [Chitinophagia bacterium]